MVEALRQLTGEANGRQVRRRSAKTATMASPENGSHQALQPDNTQRAAPTNALGDTAQHNAQHTAQDAAQHILVSGFGMINYDRGLGSGAAILSRAG